MDWEKARRQVVVQERSEPAWRRQPPTSGQLKLLRQLLGWPYSAAGMNRGQVADMIDRFKAGRQAARARRP